MRSADNRQDGTRSGATTVTDRRGPNAVGTNPFRRPRYRCMQADSVVANRATNACAAGSQISNRSVAVYIEPEGLHVERFVIRSGICFEVQIRLQFDLFLLVDDFVEELLHDALDLGRVGDRPFVAA